MIYILGVNEAILVCAWHGFFMKMVDIAKCETRAFQGYL